MVSVQKVNLFPSIVLMQNGSIKSVLKSSKTKNNLTIKNMELKPARNLHFSKGVTPRFLSKKLTLFPSFVLMQNRTVKSVV